MSTKKKRIWAVVSTLLILAIGALLGSVAANAQDNTPKPRHLTGMVHPKQENRPHKLPHNFDGCDRNYGAAHQCVPIDLPSGEKGCAYLTKHHFKSIKVVLVDDKQLDDDGDAVACN